MTVDQIKKMLEEAGVEPRPEVLDLLSEDTYSVNTPKKMPKRLERIPKKKLEDIHEYPDVAREMCLIIISNLADTHTMSVISDNPSRKKGNKQLYSPILQGQVRYKSGRTSPYRKILDLLIEEEIIEPGKKYSTELGTSNEYRLAPVYMSKGVYSYPLKTAVARKLRGKNYKQNFDRVLKTNIGKNSLMLRSLAVFPTTQEATERLKEAARNGYTSKKGKKLVMRGKKKNRYPESEYVFIEDYIQIFEYLRDCLKVPIITPLLTEERIIDCFNIMPSLIRELITINGKPIVESDFTCLHPNIAQMLYSDINNEQITHKKVAEWLGDIDVKTAKIEHLSYFNKSWEQLEHSPLHDYYMHNDHRMMERICRDKAENGYKSTSRELFRVETHMMEEVVGILNSRGIVVMYVFDAIYSADIHKAEVVEVMNEVAEKFNVRTAVKEEITVRGAA